MQLIEADEKQAKAAMYRLNQAGRRTHALEEAWIIYALVREDGLSQLEVAELLGRHKSWVCRRLALLEKLEPKCGWTCNWGCCRPRRRAISRSCHVATRSSCWNGSAGNHSRPEKFGT